MSTNEIKTSLPDIPYSGDDNDFGTERYVNGLIKFIEKSSAPMTIALQGEWGSGKTSLMTRLERSLCSKPNAPFIGVEINTWEYSMMSSPEVTVYKIIAQLVQELTKNDPQSKKTFKSFLSGAGNFLYRGARESLKTIPGVGVVIEAANVPTQLLDNSDDSKTVSLAELKNTLEQAIKERIAKENKSGVIIFIDDLDRLNPPVAVEILELLKNIFTLEKCIFVLAIDYDVVVKGLEPKFGKLTEQNEREFRSFFDKIIQVPFSLPVSSYRPMDFMLNALLNIGYLTPIETKDVEVKLSEIVEASVGKNPRSIKRLINTLSLLDCIAKCGNEPKPIKKDDLSSADEKILNFIVVAIQICYPKIYRLLTQEPAFTTWNADFVQKEEGITFQDDDKPENQWKSILKKLCSTDKYLTQHTVDIIHLLSMIDDILLLSKYGKGSEEKLKQIMDKSSVTGINAEFKTEKFDRKDLIYKLHDNVRERIFALCPGIKIKLKNNTGNGGVYVWIDDDKKFDVVFTPSINKKNQIALGIWLDFCIARPERMKGKTFDEIILDEHLSSALAELDKVLTPLLSKWYFNGSTYEGTETYFSSYREELSYIHKMGWMEDSITNNPKYWIDLEKPSLFQEPEIIDAIANVIIANYEFRKSMKNWK